MQQQSQIHHYSAGYCSISPLWDSYITGSYHSNSGIVKYVKGSETRKPLTDISSKFSQQRSPDDDIQPPTKMDLPTYQSNLIYPPLANQ
jgi:hypothetical protein